MAAFTRNTSAASLVLDQRVFPSSRRNSTASRPTDEHDLITNYHNWTNVISLNNGVIEALIVRALDGCSNSVSSRTPASCSGKLGDVWEAPRTPRPATTTTSAATSLAVAQSVWNWPPPKVLTGAQTRVLQRRRRDDDHDAGHQLPDHHDAHFEMLYNEPVLRVRTLFQRVAP